MAGKDGDNNRVGGEKLSLETGYFGISEARAEAIEQAKNLLLFDIKKNRSAAIVFVGQQKVGKTSAVLEIEQEVARSGFKLGQDYERVHTFKNIPNFPTLFFDEIPITERRLLETVSGLVGEGKRVVLDVVNKQHPQGDPRSVDEAAGVLREIFSNNLSLYKLYSVQPEDAVIAMVREGFGLNKFDLQTKPELIEILNTHLRHVQQTVKVGYFIAGETFVDAGGVLRTTLVWNGRPMYGSPFGQEVTTVFDPRLLGK